MALIASDARINASDVTEIIDTDLSDDTVNAFINTANTVVDDNLTGKGLSSALLTEIEKWLAAHFLAIRDQRVEKESVGGEWSATYQGRSGMGLEATLYGQQALRLDTSGTLAGVGLKRATFEVYSEEDSA